MEKTVSNQKKKFALNYVYAVLIGLLVIACATTIAVVNANNSNTKADIGGNAINVSANTYVVPIKNATIQKDYSASELQYNSTLKQWEIHKAIDFLATDDKNVFAVANGTVTKVYTNYLDGGVVEISHSNGMVTIYKSLENEINVSVGDVVSAGDVIGTAGETMAQEQSNGAHLHFEMLLNGVKVDPNNYLPIGNK